MTSPLLSRIRLVAPWAFIAGAALASTACGMIVGIEDVTEIPTTTATSTCSPPECAPGQCGTATNDCGDVVLCGDCGVGEKCIMAACIKEADACKELMAECGKTTYQDMPIDCGMCSDPTLNCAPDNRCCALHTCLPNECGMVTDSCGTVDCPACMVPGEMCDDSTHTCVCASLGCAELNACGDTTDNCGKSLTCPACAMMDQTCFQGKCCTPNSSPCVSGNPVGSHCGMQDLGCGVMTDCGNCGVCPDGVTMGTCQVGVCMCP